MNDLESAAIPTIEHKGRTYQITMRTFAELQMKMPLSDADRPFVSISDILRYCNSPKGICDLLALCSSSNNGYDPTTMLWDDMQTVVTRLIEKMFGPTEGTEDGKPSDPLAGQTATGS